MVYEKLPDLLQDHEYMAAMPLPLKASSLSITSAHKTNNPSKNKTPHKHNIKTSKTKNQFWVLVVVDFLTSQG